MPIGFFTEPVGDTRKTSGGVSQTSPRPVRPPQSITFSRFHSTKPKSSRDLYSQPQSSVPIHSPRFQPYSHASLSKSTTTAHRSHCSDSHTLPSLNYSLCNAPHANSVDHSHSTDSLSAPSHSSRSDFRFFDTFSNIPAHENPPIAKPSARSLNLVEASRFRPPVPASSRLTSWSSPFAQLRRQELETSLPPTLVNIAYHTVHSALAASTRTTYAAGLLRFTQFCDSWRISEDARMPASQALIVAFVAQCTGAYGGNTVRSWLAGVRSWHIINGATWNGDSDWVHLARVAANKAGTEHSRPLRAPVSFEHLHLLRRKLDLRTSFHAAVWAVALVTFFGCRRLGETTVKTSSSFNPLQNATRSSAIRFRTLRDNSSSASIHIPWTKTTKQEGASIIITARADDLCPVAALRNHLEVNKGAPPTASLFAYRNTTGTWTHMLRNTFLPFVLNIWHEGLLDHVSGHSFRIGGAVALLLAGVSAEVVAATGGWTSLAFLLYWRRMEEIIPMSTSSAYNQSQLSSLAKIFERFRIRQNISNSDLSSS